MSFQHFEPKPVSPILVSVVIVERKPGQLFLGSFEPVRDGGVPAVGSVLEILTSDLKAAYHLVQPDGSLRRTTPVRAAERLVKAAGGVKQRSLPVAQQFGSEAALRRFVLDGALQVLRESVNGTRATVVFHKGLLSAESEREKTGEYGGSHKGYNIYGVVHRLACDPVAVRKAYALLGTLFVGDLFVLEAKPLSGQPGILVLRGARNGRGGAEIGTLYVAMDPTDTDLLIVAKTERGLKTVHGQMLRFVAEKAAKEAAAAEEAARVAREAERRRKEADRIREEAEAAGDADAAAFADFSL